MVNKNLKFFFDVNIELAEESLVGITMYDLQGKLVDNIAATRLQAGFHSFKFDGNYPGKIYIIKAFVNSKQFFVRKVSRQ